MTTEAIDWEATHKEREWGIYPCEDLVRFVCKQPKPKMGAFALDIGCGAGSNVGLLQDAGYHVEGCDIAYNAVKRCRARYPKGTFSHNDFLAFKPSRRSRRYDLIVDVFSLACLPEKLYWQAMDKVFGMLNKGGRFFQKQPIRMFHKDVPKDGEYAGVYIPESDDHLHRMPNYNDRYGEVLVRHIPHNPPQEYRIFSGVKP